jgi:hypothetical protein
MNKTKYRKNRKNKKNRKKTKKVRGGADVLTVQGYYIDKGNDTDDINNKELIGYYILRDNMNEDQKKKYKDTYNIKIPSNINSDKISFDKLKLKVKVFADEFFHQKKDKTNYIKPYKTVVVHDIEDIKDIENISPLN